MALFWYTLMVLVLTSWASEQQPGSQPLRSFNDGRQDKFNGNFESIDSSAALANHQKSHSSDYVNTDRPASKIRPMAQAYHGIPQNRYGASSSSSFYEDDLRIDRFGESHDGAVIPSNSKLF